MNESSTNPESLTSLLPTLEEIRAEKARRGLAEFIRQAWHTVEPGEYRHNWHVDAIAEHLQATLAGQIENLLVTVPLKTGKSRIASVFFPAFAWISRPWLRMLYTSYSDALLVRDSRHCRQVIRSPWYKERWGHVYQLTDDQNEKINYENTQSGARVTITLEGSGTGQNAHALICDDSHDVLKVESTATRVSQIEAWDQKFSGRLIPGGAIRARIIIMQRSHHADMAAHVLKQGGYEHLMIPMEFERARKCVTGIGWSDPRTEEGQLMWPEILTPKIVADLKVRLGIAGYSAQAQQNPQPRLGNLIKRTWWKFYDAPPTEWDEIITSWDMSFKDTGESRVSGQVWCSVGANRYLLDAVVGHMNFPRTKVAVKALAARWPQIQEHVIEDKANGPAIIADLHDEISGLIPFQVSDSKTARVSAVSPSIESGNVYLPSPDVCPWVDDFIDECAAFPAEPNDQVDSMSQALLRLKSQAAPMIYF